MLVQLGLEIAVENRSHGVQSGECGGQSISSRKRWLNQCLNNGGNRLNDILYKTLF